MKKLSLIVAFAVILFYSPVLFAAGEHGGKEHGGKEHGGMKHDDSKAMKEPSNKHIKGAMKAHVMEESKKTGTFDIMDPETGKIRHLKLKKIHERVGKTGDSFYSCADFEDTGSKELLDLDLDVENKKGDLNVVDVRIHKVNGKERYTYDETDNRIPVK